VSQGIIFNIQRYSIHDGPGIRTLVFLKGCPLRCVWCANPESQSGQPEIAVVANRCIGCGKCIANCPEDAIASTQAGNVIDRTKCTACGVCVDVCYAESIQMMGYYRTVAEVLEEIEGDCIFYGQSGGGVTISGGEPFFQPEFTFLLLKACKNKGLHTAVETCGFSAYEKIEPCLPYIDLILYDIKHLDKNVHKHITGVSNSLILQNARRLSATGVELVVRMPVVPGFNDSKENLVRTAEFAREIGVTEMHLLPYHEFGRQKYQQLGREYNLVVSPPEQNRMEKLKQLLNGRGLTVRVGG